MQTTTTTQVPKKKQQTTATHNPTLFDEAEWQRLKALNCFEDAARQRGIEMIAGVDEAGRGPLAGPVVAAACIIPEGLYLEGADDSKKLTPKQRYDLFEIIIGNPNIRYAVGIVSSEEIDRINIYQATVQAMLIAVNGLDPAPELLLVDGMNLPHPKIPCQKIIGGDALSHSIAVASIIAKETRDRLMLEYHLKWPNYGFDRHKGYGTEMHRDALEKHGPCPIHRFTFEPIKSSLLILTNK